MDLATEAIQLHSKLKGKTEVKPKIEVNTKILNLLYTPGVAAIVRKIGDDREASYDLTGRGNSVAIVCDGTRILGLGNRGAEAAMPVMEGKALIYKAFGNVDAVPLCIRTQDKEEIIKFVMNITPSFGAINMEDIEAPKCLEIVDRLSEISEIPIFHDDQQGTAVITVAALLNALKIVEKDIETSKIVIFGAGAAGFGISRLLLHGGAKNLIVLDSKGIIYKGREGLNDYKLKLAELTNHELVKGDLKDAIANADVFVGVSGQKDIVTEEMVKSMNQSAIVFALTNPDPEIMPDKAKMAGARITATGRGDFDNQVNNALVFPFLMRKILDERIKKIDQELLYKAAKDLANMTKDIKESHIIPSLDEVERVQSN